MMTSLAGDSDQQESDNMEFTRKVTKSYFQELRKRSISLPSMLLIFYAIPVTMSMSIGQGIVSKLFTKSFSCSPEETIEYPFIAQWLQNVLIFCLHPFIGWLADTKIGRARTISLALWFSWFGILIQVVSLCIQYNCTNYDWLKKTAAYGISPIALVLLITGIACYQSIILAYGLDQLPDGSTAQVKRFIHWLTWSFFFGFFFNYLHIIKTVTTLSNDLFIGTTFATFTVLSLALVLHIHLRHKFHPSHTVKRNPYSIIIRVLKYAWKHKTPVNRSAFTYWENRMPSRIDLAKSEYGGPFLEGDVEDTKAFWRVVTVFCSLGGLFIPYSTVVTQGAYYGFQFYQANQFANGYGAYILWQAFYQIGIVAIPLLDLIILPLFPKVEYFIANSMKGFFAAIVSLLLGLASMLVIEGIAVARSTNEITCILVKQDFSDDSDYLNLSYYYYIIPWFFIGTAAYLTLIKAFEFICSQAPNEMGGILTGVFWLIRALFVSTGILLNYALTSIDIHRYRLPCTFWVLVAQLCICTVFTVIFFIVSMWYQQRLREHEFPIRNITERHYSRFLHSSYHHPTNEVFSKHDLPISGWSDDTIPVYSAN